MLADAIDIAVAVCKGAWRFGFRCAIGGGKGSGCGSLILENALLTVFSIFVDLGFFATLGVRAVLGAEASSYGMYRLASP